MDFNTVAILHKNNPALLALRKDWLPLAVSFLHHAFKRRHEVLLPQDLFQEQLDSYIAYVNDMLLPDDQYRHPASYYLDRWSREADLIRIRLQGEGYMVQLSPHAERLISWFEAMEHRGMIGTESRLRNLMLLLDDLVTQSNENVEQRLEQLYERRKQLDAEIERIERTQEVEMLTDVQVRERLEHLSDLANQLLGDFTLVEERFREMARSIQQAQLDPNAKRGDILGTALDAEEQLQNSDEGQSFRTFYELLTHPEQRDKFDVLVGAIFGTPRLYDLVGENYILQRLTSHLLNAGDRVNQSNLRLAEHLRRVVDTRNISESRRVQTLAGEIKYIISQLDLIPLMKNTRQPFYSIEGDPDIELPMQRPLLDPPLQVAAIERPQTALPLLDDEALANLYDVFYIDEGVLRGNIERLLMTRSEVTLVQLANSYPITQGMAELIAYLHIAARDPRHQIDHHHHDQITIINRDQIETQVLTPRILFRRIAMETSID